MVKNYPAEKIKLEATLKTKDKRYFTIQKELGELEKEREQIRGQIILLQGWINE